MKKSLLLLSGAAAMALLMNGCSSVNWEAVGYVSPANEVNLKANPSAKIVVSKQNQDVLSPIAKAVADEFAKSGQIKISDDKPDYWIVLSGAKAFRADDSQSIPFNKTVSKASRETPQGGHEVITSVDHVSSTAAATVNITIYSVTDLSPVYYFDIATYDADFKQKDVRSQAEYDKAFTEQIIRKIKDAFLVQKRTVPTAIPRNADEGMVAALRSGNFEEVVKLSRQVIPQEFEDFVADILAGKYEEQEDEKEEKLSNYYVLALAHEIGDFEPENLKALHGWHIAILKQSNSDALAEACPNSLARIELKLSKLQELK